MSTGGTAAIDGTVGAIGWTGSGIGVIGLGCGAATAICTAPGRGRASGIVTCTLGGGAVSTSVGICTCAACGKFFGGAGGTGIVSLCERTAIFSANSLGIV